MIVIDSCPRLSLTYLKRTGRFKESERKTERIQFEYLGGNAIIELDIDAPNNEFKVVTTYDGEVTHADYKLVSEPARVGKGKCWYLMCPNTGKKFRMLYFVVLMAPDGRVVSLLIPWHIIVLVGIFKYQIMSEQDRFWLRYKRITKIARKYGKMYYCGKLTPYGKRIKKAEEILAKAHREGCHFDPLNFRKA